MKLISNLKFLIIIQFQIIFLSLIINLFTILQDHMDIGCGHEIDKCLEFLEYFVSLL